MDCLIVNVPLLDPTLPPHSASYLVGAAKNCGFRDIEFYDLNIKALNSIFSCSNIEHMLSYRDHFILETARRERLSGLDSLRARACILAMPLDAARVTNAYSLFRDAKRFYDITLYYDSYCAIRSYIDLVTAKHRPYAFNLFGNWTARYGGIDSIDNLTDPMYTAGFVDPFIDAIRSFEAHLIRKKPTIIGFSANYTTQLPFLIAILKRVKNLSLPVQVVCGGTEITDLFKYVSDKKLLSRVLPNVDLLVVGEGENALVEILQANQDGRPPSHPNIVQVASPKKQVSPEIVDINSIGIPDYDCIEWEEYWSPKPVAMMSPTRGCYWNKCTFCDYGLNFGLPTSPSRQLKIENLVDTLRALTVYADTAYLAVDAIAPSYLRKLAEVISKEELYFAWSAEIRLERKLMSGDQLQRLQRGGCVALSFGYESGDRRILDLIDKGVDLEVVPRLIASLREAGIKVQMMGFTGFPSESPEEANRTYEFLEENSENWLIAGIGPFVLTPGAIIAKNPVKFGITRTVKEGKHIHRTLGWERPDGSIEPGDRYLSLARQGLNPFRMVRPFVGGIDTAHTILYSKRFEWGELVDMAEEGISPKAWEVVMPIGNVAEWPDLESLGVRCKEVCCRDMLSNLEAFEVIVEQREERYFVVDEAEIYKSTGSDAMDKAIIETARGVTRREKAKSLAVA